MRPLSVETTAMRRHLAGVVTFQGHVHGEVAVIKHRPDRIGRRLERSD